MFKTIGNILVNRQRTGVSLFGSVSKGVARGLWGKPPSGRDQGAR